ncbi:MAG: DUF5057 domain-containing protein [Clostridia bacterium]|nr:DUF5057 domain-containing protein [Clostridia bacterium]
MMKEKNNLSKVTAVVLAVSMILGTVASIVTNAGTDEPVSLGYIEHIKRQKNDGGTAFRILEVAPSKSQSSMGYYVDGYEPVANWPQEAAAIPTKFSRTEYVNNMFNALGKAGLLSEQDNAAPLKKIGDYKEYYPWEEVPDDATQLTLNNGETVTDIHGGFEADENGSYILEAKYFLPSLFDAEGWYSNLMSNVSSGNIGNNGFNCTGAEVALEGEKIVVKASPTVGNADYDVYTMYGGSDFYKMDCEPNTDYTINYTAEIEGDGSGQIFIFGYKQDYSGENVVWHERPISSTGTYFDGDSTHYERHFHTGANDEWLGIRFGTAEEPDTTAKFSDVLIYKTDDKYAGADSVQDAKEFYYGDAGENQNIFSLFDFFDNFVSNSEQNSSYVADGTVDNISFDGEVLKINANVSMPVAYNYAGADGALARKFYIVPVEPGTSYTYSYTTRNTQRVENVSLPTRSYVQIIGLTDDYGQQNILTDGESQYEQTGQETKTGTFTTDANIKYLIVSFGVGNDNTIAEWWDFSIISNEATTDTSGLYYYYDVNFTQKALNEFENGGYVYIKNDNGTPDDPDDDYYELIRVKTEENENDFPVGVQFYSAELNPDVGPQIYFDAGHPYRTPRTSAYHRAADGETPYFASITGVGTYVGEGYGDYIFNPEIDNTVSIITDTVFYTGGYSNNEWFKYYVLDYDDEDVFSVHVDTLTPAELDDKLGSIEYYDLVVFTAGTGSDGSVGAFSTDLSTDFMTRYNQSEGNEKPYYTFKTPTLIDKAILDNDETPPNLKAFLNDYLAEESGKKGSTTGWVEDFVYCFNFADSTTENSEISSYYRYITSFTKYLGEIPDGAAIKVRSGSGYADFGTYHIYNGNDWYIEANGSRIKKDENNGNWYKVDSNNNKLEKTDVEYSEFYYEIAIANTSLANPWFNSLIISSLYAEGAPYGDVKSEIDMEVSIRGADGNPLPQTYVSIGTSIRYILNFAGQRVILDKDTIRILDIEPYTSGKVYQFINGKPVLKAISKIGSATFTHTVVNNSTGEVSDVTETLEGYQYNYTGYGSESSDQHVNYNTPDYDPPTTNYDTYKSREILTEEKVLSWFPDTDGDGEPNGPAYFTDDGNLLPAKIEIVTMATNELIADADDISETYDLVYIGDSTYNMNISADVPTSGRAKGRANSPNYNDPNMDGMYYTCTGDLMSTNARNFWGEDTLGGISGIDYYWTTTQTSVSWSEWVTGIFTLDGERLRDLFFRTLFKGLGNFYDADSPGAFMKGWQTFRVRSSGNDLTAVKEQQLETFMKAGLPVVVADELTSGYQVSYVARCNFEAEFKYQKTHNGLLSIFLRRIACYHIKLYAWFEGEGLPNEFDPETCIDITWYKNGQVISNDVNKMGTGTYNGKFAYTYEPGNVNIPNVGYCVKIDEADAYLGQYYAVIQIKNTGTDMDGKTVKTDRIVVSFKTKTVYARGERIQGKEYDVTADDGSTVTMFREVWPSDLPASYVDRYDFYMPRGQTSNTWYYTVRFYDTSDHNIQNRTFVSVENDWHYRGFAGVTYKISGNYHTLDYIKEGNGDGEMSNNGGGSDIWAWKYEVNGRGYNKITYVNSSGNRDDVRVGTPNWSSEYNHERTIGIRYVDVERLPVGEGFGEASGPFVSNAGVDEISVDNASYMYKFLSKAFERDANENQKYPNVFAEREFAFKEENKLSLKNNYIMFSTPKISVVESTVTAYPNTISAQGEGITCEFSIQNPTGKDVENAKYKLLFYVDLNNDGKFKKDERQDINVFVSENGGSYTEIDPSNDTLRATTKTDIYSYRVQRKLPSDWTGILPWKLEIIELDEHNHWSTVAPSSGVSDKELDANYANLHDSYTNLAYCKPDQATRIRVLQILPSNWPMQYTSIDDLDLDNMGVDPGDDSGVNEDEYDLNDESLYYGSNEFIGSIFESDNFKKACGKGNWQKVEGTGIANYIGSQTSLTATDTLYMAFGPDDNKENYSSYLNNYISTGELGSSNAPDFVVELKCINVKTLNTLYGDQDDDGYQIRKDNTLFDTYDMLVLGFADSWGKAGQKDMSLPTTNIGMNMGAAFAIQDFIKSGRAVLLTHDTTTTYNNFPNNVILKKAFEAALSVLGGVASIFDFFAWIGSLFGGDGHSEIADKIRLWVSSMTVDERQRNGYWVNLIRDECGLDRYGATYSIKQKAAASVTTWVCTKCGRVHYTSNKPATCLAIGCINNTFDKVETSELTDRSLSKGYFNDFRQNHEGSIYTDNDTTGYGNWQNVTTEVMQSPGKDYSIAYVPGSREDVSNTSVKTYSYTDPITKQSNNYAYVYNQKADGTWERRKTDQFIGGYTRYEIARMSEQSDSNYLATAPMYSSNDETYGTTFVTQTNKGKLTTYPYDLNFYKYEEDGVTKIVDENGGYMFDESRVERVTLTHDQVYQLNMNGDDVTCWYCMSGGNFADIPNDALNAYYIYSRRNITYTGAGHTNTFTPWEAKLFANTLISAYRPAAEIATIQFVKPESQHDYNEDYTASPSYILLTQRTVTSEPDAEGNTQETIEIDSEQIHFELINPNLSNSTSDTKREIKVEVRLGGSDGEIIDGGTLVYGDDVESAEELKHRNWNSISDNGNYSFYVPDAVIQELAQEGVNKVQLTLIPITKTDDDEIRGTPVSIEVRLLGLNGLS